VRDVSRHAPILSRSWGCGARRWALLRLPRAAKPESLSHEFARGCGNKARGTPLREDAHYVEIRFANDQLLADEVVQRLPLLANKEEWSRITPNL
jgi:hypothetical protein